MGGVAGAGGDADVEFVVEEGGAFGVERYGGVVASEVEGYGGVGGGFELKGVGVGGAGFAEDLGLGGAGAAQGKGLRQGDFNGGERQGERCRCAGVCPRG